MNYKQKYHYAVCAFILLAIISGFALIHIHKSLNKVHETLALIQEEANESTIRAYQEAGWMPDDKTQVNGN